MKLNTEAKVIPLPQKKGGTSMSVLRLVKSRVDEKTDFLIEGLKENIADALFEEMTSIEEQEALTHHFNIMRAMKVEEAAWRVKFSQLGSRTWVNFIKRMDERHIEKPTGPMAEIIEAYSKRTTNHYKVLIQETRFRFQTLFQREVTRHPLQPDLYYRYFWQALRETDLTYDERMLVVPLFHRFVMDRYGQILTLANRTLIELKIDTTLQLPTSSQ